MGYSTTMFGVDIERIKLAIKNHDTSVLDAVREEHPDAWEPALNEREPSVGAGLEGIIKGNVLDIAHAHVYGYAFQLWCRTLDEWLPDDDMIADLESLELQSPLEICRTPIEI